MSLLGGYPCKRLRKVLWWLLLSAFPQQYEFKSTEFIFFERLTLNQAKRALKIVRIYKKKLEKIGKLEKLEKQTKTNQTKRPKASFSSPRFLKKMGRAGGQSVRNQCEDVVLFSRLDSFLIFTKILLY